MIVERYPNPKEEIGGLIPRCEISSLLDINLTLASRSSVSKNPKKKTWLKLNTAGKLPIILEESIKYNPI